MILEAEIASKRAGARLVIAGLRLTLGAGEVVALVGPSGCGKTTTLRILAGLDRAYTGRVAWHTAGPPRIGTVFQEPRLLPWRTVAENIALVRPDPAVASALLERLGLLPFLHLYPPALSLGMARRAALARAVAVRPDALLLDEPFVSLDPATAQAARSALQDAIELHPCAVLLVTHDLAEAASLADRILVLSASPALVVRELTVPKRGDRRSLADGARFLAESGLAAERG